MYDVFAVVLIKLTKLQLLLWLAGQAGWLRQDGHLQEQGENSGGSVIRLPRARRDCCVCCALPDHSRISPHLSFKLDVLTTLTPTERNIDHDFCLLLSFFLICT